VLPGNDPLVVGTRSFASRLFLGTGKYSSYAAMRDAIVASGTEVVTVALRRVDETRAGDDILDFLPADVLLLPNTSGAANADDAVRLARLARAGGMPDFVKLEVHPDPRYLLPDPIETLRAAERLVAEGFTVLPYCSADPVLCKHLEEAGCATVMPLGSWIGWDPQRLGVALKAAAVLGRLVQGVLAVVAERRVAKVVRQGRRFHDVGVEATQRVEQRRV